MIILNYKNQLYKYFLYISALLVTLFIIVNVFYKEPAKDLKDVKTSTITYKDELTEVNVEYPRFKDDKINKLITDIIYDYVKEFKKFDTVQKSLIMDYKLYYFDDYVNITFNIENTLEKAKNKNILLNLKKKEISYISNIYDKEYLENEINEIVYYKYQTDVYEKIKESNINNNTYIIDENKIEVYFNNINFENLDYIPYIIIPLTEDTFNEDEVPDENKKYIAFTFDDGPSKYTKELLKTLELNESTATFFMLGNRMKYNEEIVKEVYKSSSEVASHTYSHKNLNKLSKDNILKEINSTSIIFNKITNDNIKYIRPPYGNYNDTVKSTNYPIILWNIDPKDWLVKDSTKVYNAVLKHACDGCIVLLHDLYPTTIEAVKMLIPKLNSMGYEIVSISDLAKYKNYNLKNGEIIRKIK